MDFTIFLQAGKIEGSAAICGYIFLAITSATL
jgi:hypothetical protein